MGYTQEQIGRANQVNLEQFLRSQGEKLIKSGHEYRWERYDSLTVKGNKWFRHSQSKGGYPIYFVMEFFDKTFPEAVQMLIGEEAVECVAEMSPKAEFKLPPRCESNERIIKYLMEERKLPKDLIEEFITNGLIYEDAKHHNVIFMGTDENGDVEQTEVDWLWYPYIPFGKLTIVQGNPGEGKTFFAMQLAAACTNKKFLPDMEPFEPFNMIFQTAEDGLGDTVKPRLVSPVLI